MFIVGDKKTGFKLHFSFPQDLLKPPLVPAAQPMVMIELSVEKARELECKLEEVNNPKPPEPESTPTASNDAAQKLENHLVELYMAYCGWPMPDTSVPDADYSELEQAVEVVRWFLAQVQPNLKE